MNRRPERWAETPRRCREAGVEALVIGADGFFINALPLGVRAGDDPGFAPFPAGCATISLGAFAHQHGPFERLVKRNSPAAATPPRPGLSRSLSE